MEFFFVLIADKSEADAPFTTPEKFPAIVAGSAFIVPSSTLQKVEPPSIDRNGVQSNVSASIGRTAYLRCKVKNLGHKSVNPSEIQFCYEQACAVAQRMCIQGYRDC